MKPTD
ncbi:hypothetical protein V2J09_005779 [Rumex salicifolius]